MKHADHIKGILAQKPLATNLADAAEIVRLCDEAGITLAVNQNMRYDQSMRALKTLLDRGYLGEPVVGPDHDARSAPLAELHPRVRPGGDAQHEHPPPGCLSASSSAIRSGSWSASAPIRALDFPHSDGMAFYILEYADGLRAVGIDNTFSWVDHGIEWRVEGTEGVAKGTIGWPDYPAGSPSTIDFLTKRRPDYWFQPRWQEQWFPQAFIGTMAPADARGRDGHRAGDLRSRQPEDDGPDRSGLPLGARGARGRPGQEMAEAPA